MFLFLISALIVLISSLFLISLFRPESKIAAVAGWFLMGFSLIVLVELTANLFQALDQPWVILLIQLVFLGISYLAWRVSNRPRLGGPLFLHNVSETLFNWRDAWKGHYENLLLTAFGLLMYGYSFFLGVSVAPNTYDSITTHAVRVVYWLQHGNMLPWVTPRTTQLTYPVNAQLQMLWSAQFLHSDKFFFMVQFLGGVISVLCVIGIARLLKFSRAQALFAGLIFATYPLIWMQSSTTQNDLIAAGIFLPVVYFFFLGIERRQAAMLGLSGIALGLSLGTKQTLFFYLPGLALLAGMVWFKYRGAVSRLILSWAAASLVSFVVLSSFIYIQNYLYFDNPLATKEALETSVGGTSEDQIKGNLSYNTLRLIYQSFDNSGLPEPFSGYFTKVKNRTLGEVLRWVNPLLHSNLYTASGHSFDLSAENYLSEDSAWYGPVGGLLYLPLVIIQSILGWKRKDPWRLGLVGISLTFLLMNVWLRPGWDPYQGRYFIPAAALTTAFFADLVRPKAVFRIGTTATALLAMIMLVYTAMINPGKWVVGEKPEINMFYENLTSIVKRDWSNDVTAQNRNSRVYTDLVKANLPDDAPLGWYAGIFIEYPLFGEDLSTPLIPIHPHERVRDADWLEEQNLDYILMDVNVQTDPFPQGYVELDSVFNWILLVRK